MQFCFGLIKNYLCFKGAASGIGAATAKELSKQGALLSLFDLNQERLAQVANECEKLGAKDVSLNQSSKQSYSERNKQLIEKVKAN